MGDSFNLDFTEKLIQNYGQVESIMKNTSFDALMTPAYYANGFFYLSQVFEVPLIVFSLEGPLVGLYGHMGNPDNPSWQVSNYAPLVEPFSFSDRLYNFFSKFLLLGYQRLHLNLFHRELEKRYKTSVPDLQELEHGDSILVEDENWPKEICRVYFRCDPGYQLEGPANIYCFYGVWTGDVPQCISKLLLVLYMRLIHHYACIIRLIRPLKGSSAYPLS